MASLCPNSLMFDISKGSINLDGDTFKLSLHTNAYTPDKSHYKFNQVTNEVTGTGYTAGGNTIDIATGTIDTTNNRVDITIPGSTWSSSTITARYGCVRKARGGASTADEVVCIIDFGSDIISVNGTFTVTASTLRLPQPT